MDNNDISSSGFVIQENNSEMISSFHSIKEIETKGYSCLYTATKFGKKVILKGLKPEFKKERFYQDLLKKEFEISYFLDHPNIVKIIDFGLSDADDYVVLKQAAGTRKYAAPEQIVPNNTIDCRADIYSLGIILKNNFPKSYHKIAEKCAQQDKEKRFSSVGDIRNFIKKKKITKITVATSLIILLLFALSFIVTKHYISDRTYNLNEKKILTESTQFIDSQIEIIKNKIKEGPTSSLDKYNEVVKIYYELTTLDHKKWLDNIPSDIPFYNDFMTHWNTYFGENHKDVIMSYIYWNQESLQLIFSNLKSGENIVADEEIPVMFRIIDN